MTTRLRIKNHDLRACTWSDWSLKWKDAAAQLVGGPTKPKAGIIVVQEVGGTRTFKTVAIKRSINLLLDSWYVRDSGAPVDQRLIRIFNFLNATKHVFLELRCPRHDFNGTALSEPFDTKRGFRLGDFNRVNSLNYSWIFINNHIVSSACSRLDKEAKHMGLKRTKARRKFACHQKKQTSHSRLGPMSLFPVIPRLSWNQNQHQ